MPDRALHARVPEQQPVVGSMAGRAFVDAACTIADRDDDARVWAPIIEGSDRTGVLALTLPEVTDTTIAECEELGLLAGYLIATPACTTDLYNLHRRRRVLSLAASMQWDLLPPLVLKTPSVTVAGLLEPAYDVGGDCFDYALNDRVLSVGVMDAMGHGVGAALISALGIGSYRHDRREGRVLEQIHTNLDAAIGTHCPPFTYATGQLAQLDVDTGARDGRTPDTHSRSYPRRQRDRRVGMSPQLAVGPRLGIGSWRGPRRGRRVPRTWRRRVVLHRRCGGSPRTRRRPLRSRAPRRPHRSSRRPIDSNPKRSSAKSSKPSSSTTTNGSVTTRRSCCSAGTARTPR